MAILTYTQQLESVQAAIAAVEGGAQEWEIDTPLGRRRGVRARIDYLYAQERRLRRLVASEARGGIRQRYGTAQG